MAKFDLYFPQIIQLEGDYFEDVPGDSGGATKYGITIGDFKENGYDINKDGKIDVNDLKLMNHNDAFNIYKNEYWNPIQGDLINNQIIANIICDFAINNGLITAIKNIQTLLYLTSDGKLGPKSLAAINNSDPKILLEKIKKLRKDLYMNIVKNYPKNQKFLKGWLNRVDAFILK